MKFDRRMLIPFERDGDSPKLVKSNDEYAYRYMGGNDGPRHATVEVTVK